MERLFLTSTNIDLLPNLLPQEASKLKLAFIPTAADPYIDKWFVAADYNKLNGWGFKLIETNLNKKTPKTLAKELKDVDIIYVTGGNTFYLLQKSIESGFSRLINELIRNGVLYVGSSAGAIIAGPNIYPIRFIDDPSKAPRLKSFNGFNLVDFVVLPHFGNEKYRDKYEEVTREYKSLNYKVIPITDEQVVTVAEGSYKISDV